MYMEKNILIKKETQFNYKYFKKFPMQFRSLDQFFCNKKRNNLSAKVINVMRKKNAQTNSIAQVDCEEQFE